MLLNKNFDTLKSTTFSYELYLVGSSLQEFGLRRQIVDA